MPHRSHVETVLGPKLIWDLGRILTHEHISIDYTEFYVAPPKELQSFLLDEIKLNNVGYIKQYPYSNKHNLTLKDMDATEAVLKDLISFREFGGGTIVENSSHGLKCDYSFLKKVSSESKVNVIAGTGFYVANSQEASILNMRKEQMHETIYNDLEHGFKEDPSVKAGFIGEVGCSWPLKEFEKTSIRVTGEVQGVLHCPVSFHPGRHPDAPEEILRLYQEAGGDAKKAIMSHMERTICCESELLRFMEDNRCFCQFDLFGTECSYYQLKPSFPMPSDAQRIKLLTAIHEHDMLNRVLLSHDIHTKHRLVSFGGHGYSHIQNNILPLLEKKGFSKHEIEMLTIHNPREWL